jgi:acetyl-CoA C-acetyltransferase
MPGIKDRVAIIGMGCTNFGELWDKGAEDLMVDACYEAYENAGVDPKAEKASGRPPERPDAFYVNCL